MHGSLGPRDPAWPKNSVSIGSAVFIAYSRVTSTQTVTRRQTMHHGLMAIIRHLQQQPASVHRVHAMRSNKKNKKTNPKLSCGLHCTCMMIIIAHNCGIQIQYGATVLFTLIALQTVIIASRCLLDGAARRTWTVEQLHLYTCWLDLSWSSSLAFVSLFINEHATLHDVSIGDAPAGQPG